MRPAGSADLQAQPHADGITYEANCVPRLVGRFCRPSGLTQSMLAAGPRQTLLAAFSLLLLGCDHPTRAAPGDVGPAALTPVETDFCEEPVELEPGLSSVHCISPAIRMNPGQVHLLHKSSSHQNSNPTDMSCKRHMDSRCRVGCAPCAAGCQHQFALSQPLPGTSDSCDSQSVSTTDSCGRQTASHPKRSKQLHYLQPLQITSYSEAS